jgi:hypothetical protein
MAKHGSKTRTFPKWSGAERPAIHRRFFRWLSRSDARPKGMGDRKDPNQNPNQRTTYPSERFLAGIGAELVTRRD